MARRLGWLALGVLAAGVAAALVMRLALPARVLQLGFQSDPASLVLVSAAVAAAVLGAGALAVRALQSRYRAALTAQAAAQETERRRFIMRLDHELKNPITAIQVQL